LWLGRFLLRHSPKVHAVLPAPDVETPAAHPEKARRDAPEKFLPGGDWRRRPRVKLQRRCDEVRERGVCAMGVTRYAEPRSKRRRRPASPARREPAICQEDGWPAWCCRSRAGRTAADYVHRPPLLP